MTRRCWHAQGEPRVQPYGYRTLCPVGKQRMGEAERRKGRKNIKGQTPGLTWGQGGWHL